MRTIEHKGHKKWADIILDFAGRQSVYETGSNRIGLDYLLSEEKKDMDRVGARLFLALGAVPMGLGAMSIVTFSRFNPFVQVEGPNGFKRWKLQTMRPGAQKQERQLIENGSHARLKKDGDKRITVEGKVLRAISIDEIPTFWDVLKTRMSLVGPKPFTLEEFNFYIAPNAAVEPYKSYIELLGRGVKYGFFGPYLLDGRDGQEYHYRVKKDLLYMRLASEDSDRRMIWLNGLATVLYRGK